MGQGTARAMGFSVEVRAEPEPAPARRRLFGLLAAIFDAASSAETGMPPVGPGPDSSTRWSVVILDSSQRIVSRVGPIYDYSRAEAQQAEFANLIAEYSPEELHRIIDARR